ncbi:MAG: hypothetical protein LKM39_10130 [Chiayiivirga sp.]|nr:hypothetical protein [Chiayiivirga sp.]
MLDRFVKQGDFAGEARVALVLHSDQVVEVLHHAKADHHRHEGGAGQHGVELLLPLLAPLGAPGK